MSGELQQVPAIPVVESSHSRAMREVDESYAWRRRLTAGALVLTAAFAAQMSPHEPAETHDRPVAISDQYADEPVRLGLKQAPPVRPQTISLVQELLNSPENPNVKTFEDDVQAKESLRNAGLAVAYPERTQTQFREHEKYLLRKEVADKYGLTVFDESQTVAELSNYQEPLSTVDFMQTANEFLAKYDLWIGSDPLATYGHNMEAADAKQLRRGASGRAAVIGVIRAVASKPKQYFDKLGIQRVLLAQQEPDMPMRAGGYIASDLASKDIGPSFVMNLDAVSTFQDAQTIAEHEIRHRLTYLEDGGAYDNDPTFNNVVGTDVYGKIGPEPPDSEPDTRPYVADKQDLHSVEQYQKAVSKIDFNISAHIGDASCYEVAESIDATVQKLGSTVYYASNYSKKSVVEHKAELPVTEPDRYKVYLDENLPHIQEQFEYGVANMYEWSPRIARYFIELSERPNTRPDADADLSVITKLNSRQADCKWYELHPERVKELKG